MEEVFGLAQDDALARMMIVQLRVVDRDEGVWRERSKKEEEFIKEVRTILLDLRKAAREVEAASAKLGRWSWFRRETAWEGAAPIGVDSYRKASPLLSYLGCAFRPQRGGLDEDERTRAARWDLVSLCGVIVLLMLVAAWFGHHTS